MIIDFHAHIYPEKIAVKAGQSINKYYDDAPVRLRGTAEDLLENGSKAGVTKYVVQSVATNSAQVEGINNFILSECKAHPEFIGFGTIHPEYENFAAELERIKAAGLKGVKVHPDFQEFRADVESMDPVYAKMAELKLPVLFHAGDCRYDYSNPKYIANVHKKHPDLVIIAAHFGGYTQWDEAYEYLCGTDVYFDTSSTLWKLPVEKAKKMIAKHGYEKFLFGTDYPMWIHTEEIESLKVLGFTPEQTEAVMYKNALGLFKKCGIKI